MSNVELVGDADNPTATLVKVPNGMVVDFKNISGKLKSALIANGDMAPEKFFLPPNMTGKKLAEYRAKYKANWEKQNKVVKKTPDQEKEVLQVGDIVTTLAGSGKFTYEILETKDEKAKIQVRKNGKLEDRWIPLAKLVKA